MKRTRIFQSGNSQAVRLPKQFRFRVNEVEIFRRGDEIVLKAPKRNLKSAFQALAAFPKDFMVRGRRDDRPQERDDL